MGYAQNDDLVHSWDFDDLYRGLPTFVRLATTGECATDGETGVRRSAAADADSERTRPAASAAGRLPDAATAAGFSVDRKQIVLRAPIKELGLHDVTVVLHPEVSATITMNVARSPEEAELQASGKSVRELAAEAEAAADFEIAELFDDMGAAASEE